ncbi:family 78 glycoside hydrolase catalytic domain [Paenibacillus sp. FSL R10-2734]|uniref:family 78 glycoside hydrolase catalytic domain n=1 Tax=Paenibacillus sp. FSL R10-2734 TaxID=2954691 RepID=UPI0030DA45D2
MRAIHLKTEYLANPVTLDILNPRFFWKCDGGVKQTAYQIQAICNDSVIWDSGKVSSASMTHIRYDGQTLHSRDVVYWSVKLWDENDGEGEWVTSSFEMGLLEEEDWRAKWISGNYSPENNTRYPVDCFKLEFLAESEIKKARLYITANGLYEAKINGLKVGDFCLAPGCTDYRYRLQYQAYDVTSMLNNDNTLEIQLADGWYRGSIGCFGLTNVFGRQTKLLCQLEVHYADGTTETMISDEHFRWSNDGPLRFADLKDGEVYDASKVPSYSGNAIVVPEDRVPTASMNVDVREKEVFTATLMTTPNGKKVLDFGQNIAGFISFTVRGEKGQIIKLRCGEILDDNGEFTQENIQVKKPANEFGQETEFLLITGNSSEIKDELVPTPKQEIEFICSGNTDNYKMAFSVFGFQYAEIETEVQFDASQFSAIAVYSDLEQTGDFECSNDNVNKFFENTRWSMKGNFLDIPTDCPTRERLGWTGDAQVFFNTGAFFMNVAPFFRKWMLDIADGQFEDGRSSAVVPYTGADMMYKATGGSVGWGDAVVLIPYRYWKRYGDLSIIRDCYTVMRKYAMYMIENTGPVDVLEANENPYSRYTYEKGMHLGEWLEAENYGDGPISSSTRRTEECTAYLHYTMTHMAEIACTLGKSEDEKRFTEYAEGAKKAYDWLFLQSGTIDTDRQAKLVRPLALGLLSGEKKQNVSHRLVKAVENRGYHIGTGFLSTPFILPVLTEAGRADIAYKMLENEDAPSWLAEVKAGATTVWENWNGEASRNHYSPGSVCEWLFDTVGGIRMSGENSFIIQPIPGGTLTYANAQYDSIYGAVASKWEATNTGYRFHIEVPSNTNAKIIMPNNETYDVTCGTFIYEL